MLCAAPGVRSTSIYTFRHEGLLERVVERLGCRAAVAVVNVDDVRLKAVDYRVQSIPSLVLFEDGQAIRTMVGRPSEGEIVAELETAISHLNASRS